MFFRLRSIVAPSVGGDADPTNFKPQNVVGATNRLRPQMNLVFVGRAFPLVGVDADPANEITVFAYGRLAFCIS